jgi:MFS family permease
MLNRFYYLKSKYPGVLLLGCISFFTDIASEMLYPITPIFLTTILGSSMTNVGLIEGIAEGVSSLLKTYTGFWSDRTAKRKPFLLFGYFLSAISRPLIGLSTFPLQVLGARVTDRVGKGLRTAPRDAMIADMVEPAERGLAFGWHRALDTLGAVAGPLLTLIFLKYFTDLRHAYFYALIPGLLSVTFIFFLQEPPRLDRIVAQKFSFQWKNLNPDYKVFIIGWTLFCLTNSSDAFLILKMKDGGVKFSEIILLYAWYNLVYASFSPYLGNLSDRLGAKKILLMGLSLFTIVYVGFAYSTHKYQFAVLLALYGIYMAATEGVSKAYVSKLTSPETRATALGLLGTFSGLAQILASLVTGILWDQYGATVALLFSCLGSLALIMLLSFSGKMK